MRSRLSSVNLGGWQTNNPALLHVLPGDSLCVIQETLLTEQTLKTARKSLESTQRGLIHTPPAQRRLCKGGRWKVDRQGAPGVGIIHPLAMNVTPVACRTLAGQQHYESGRFLLACVEMETRPPWYLGSLLRTQWP